VGIRGVRIQAIVRELNDEKIDVIEWNSDPAAFIAKALSPARVTGVYLNEQTKGTKTATVVVPEDQLSLAIGRDGQNARLAAKLTGWRIDIKSLPEAASDVLYRIENDPEYAEEAELEAEVIPQVEAILTKKSEGRPVTPEEYTVLSRLVDRVEERAMQRRQAERQALRARKEEARAAVPEEAFELPVDEMELSTRWSTLLEEAGYDSAGDVMYQMNLNADKILALNGIGPKAMEEIESAITDVELPGQEVEEVEAEEAVVASEVAPEAVAEAEAPEAVTAEPEEVSAPEAPVVEPPAPEPEVPEPITEPAPAVEEPVDEAEAAEEEKEEGEEAEFSLEELFARKLAELAVSEELEEEEEEEEEFEPEVDRRKKKGRQKKYVEVEYDPDHDVTIVKRKRKRGETDWEDDWDY
jgi:N utilization substance protein A